MPEIKHYEEDFAYIEITPGVTPGDVTQLVVPGRGLDPTQPHGLQQAGYDRYMHASSFWHAQSLIGIEAAAIHCWGNKTPVQRHLPGVEAELGKKLLVADGVPEDAIVTNAGPANRDTPMNFILGKRCLPPGKPYAIVAQKGQLQRIISTILPRTISTEYPAVGLLVPEIGEHDQDGLGAKLHSQLVLRGLTPDNPRLEKIADRRSKILWAGFTAGQLLSKSLRSIID